MSARGRLGAAALAAAGSVALGVAATWPIYQDWWLLVPAAAALLLGVGAAALASRRPWPGAAAAVLLFVLFVLSVAPVAVPQSLQQGQPLQQLPAGLLRGTVDGVAAVVLGWKQLLTLSLPVGTYQTMMVPVYVVFLLSAFLTTWIAIRAGRFAPCAVLPIVAPVAFGTLFGSSALSSPLQLGALSVPAPRELGLWAAAAALGALWVAYTSGAERRAALRLGRAGSGAASSGRAARPALGAATLAVALLAALLLAPVFDRQARAVPRDRISPELVIREQPSPLVGYRSYKRDDAFGTELFSVTADGPLPARLRLAVLDAYDGVDFHVGANEAGRFDRFPSGQRLADPTRVDVRIGPGYAGIWAPTSGLGSVPSFSGARAAELADSFYVNRSTEAAIAVPGGRGSAGLRDGDGYRATMSAAADGALAGEPGGGSPDFDPESMPQLVTWVSAQHQPATGQGLTELVGRLRQRGYLSHSLSDGAGDREWIDRLAAQYGTRFERSAGGHSIARIEQLFAQLNAQQQRAGDQATPEQLVAGVGDDEQFAAAAALIARALGFDSRVVLGVRLGAPSDGVPGVPACSVACTGENLAAWIEVRDAAGRWVPIDATPQLELAPRSLEQGEQAPPFPTVPDERDAHEVDPPLGTGEQSELADQAKDRGGLPWLLPVLRIAGLSLAAVALLALPLLFLPFAKRLRRRRRRSSREPELRALGAWQELLDHAADSGIALPPGSGRGAAADAVGTAPARWAAAQVDRAVFSPRGIGEEDAEWIWAAVDADRRERESTMTRWQRLRRAYALRSYGSKFAARRRSAGESAADTLPQAGRGGARA